MKRYAAIFALWLVAAWPAHCQGQLQIYPVSQPWLAFPGQAKRVPIQVQNLGKDMVDASIETQVYQTTSATAVLRSVAAWKEIKILPGQTVVDSTPLNFPLVKAETRFFVQWWQDPTNRIGQAQVIVYPTNLLDELKPLGADEPLGVFDPQNQLKPLLQSLNLDFVDLEIVDVANFTGCLAIIGPFQSESQIRGGLGHEVKMLAKKGAAIVWIQPPPKPEHKLEPSFYPTFEGKGLIVTAQSNLIGDLANDPQAQLNLLALCRFAVDPQPFAAADELSSQP